MNELKNGIKFSLIILGIIIGLAALGWGLVFILRNCGLMFRAWVGTTYFLIMMILGQALVSVIVYTLSKLFSTTQNFKHKKALAAIGIIAVLLSSGVLGISVLFGWTFTYQPEHVVDKHGQKMVAYVNSFLDVNVTYYEYLNFFVCGYTVLGREWYGSGGYDPFMREPVPEPKTYKFYDTQGKVIAQSEE